MQLCRNRVTGGEAEFGVLDQYFDSELHLVNDSLSGTVVRTEEFKVAEIVVETVTVDVMYGFFGFKFSTNMLLHIVSMFKNFMHGVAVSGWNSKHDVVSFDASGYFRDSVTFAMQFTCPFVFALFAAQFLLSVDGSGTFAAGFIEFFIAVFAVCFVLLVGSFSTSKIRAGSRTIHWVFIEFLSIFFQVSRFVEKFFVAFSAEKFGFGCQSGGSTVNCFVSGNTSFGAKTLLSVTWFYRKIGSALFAGFGDRHGFVSCVGFSSGSLVK